MGFLQKFWFRWVIIVSLITMSSGVGSAMQVEDEPMDMNTLNPLFLGATLCELVGVSSPSIFERFETERLSYRLVEKGDCAEILAFMSSPGISEKLYDTETDASQKEEILNRFCNGTEQLREIFATKKVFHLPRDMLWIASLKRTNQFIGFIGYTVAPMALAPLGDLHYTYAMDMHRVPYIDINYAVEQESQRQGFATEMTTGLIPLFFQYTTAVAFIHCSHPDNTGSAMSATRCGFLEKGINGDGNTFRILRKSIVQAELHDDNPSIYGPDIADGLALEQNVFQLIHDSKICINLLDTTEKEARAWSPPYDYVSPKVKKLPADIEEMRRWCAEGYHCAEFEEPEKLNEVHYTLKLFMFGVQNNKVPLVRYILEYHNNIWDRLHLSDELMFEYTDKVSCTLVTYLIRKDYIELFDFLIQNKSFIKYCFQDNLKNGVGNTPYHTMAKYASYDLIKRFQQERELLELCLSPQNFNGEDCRSPLSLAKRMHRSPEIIGLFE